EHHEAVSQSGGGDLVAELIGALAPGKENEPEVRARPSRLDEGAEQAVVLAFDLRVDPRRTEHEDAAAVLRLPFRTCVTSSRTVALIIHGVRQVQRVGESEPPAMR